MTPRQQLAQKIIGRTALFLVVAALVFHLIAPGIADRSTNLIYEHEPFAISDEAKALHADLFIMDWHADTLMWPRNLNELAQNGHVDLPRLKAGNVSAQMFTTVTKSPAGQNYERNSADSDRLTLLFAAQGWPIEAWGSLFGRAIHMQAKLQDFVTESDGGIIFVNSRYDFAEFLRQRTAKLDAGEPAPVAALLGTEGLHAAEGKIDNVDAMIEAGFRMFGLTHFFDNELGGSLHGLDQEGLTAFGRQVVRRLNDRGMIIDLAHASEQMAWDVLSLTDRPVVVSHTGFKGDKAVTRNFPDPLMQAIAQKGGLIAVGFWDGAVDSAEPADIAKSIKYGIGLVGEDHVALGSDWDGATETITAAELVAITDALLKAGLTETQVRKVMGENSRRFLLENLPE